MILAANWKMHKTSSETVEFVEALQGKEEISKGIQIIICPPFTSLAAAREKQTSEIWSLGAQNVHWEEEGAFTGEISPLMLKDWGVEYVIVGHSERRHLMGETDEMINRKIKTLFQHELLPIFCVGETETEREEGRTEEVLRRQVQEGLREVREDLLPRLIVAYEPVWAIGTGKAATEGDAAKAAGLIRNTVKAMSKEAGERLQILYGGSVKAANIAQFLSLEEVQGALIGGASLDPESFAGLIQASQGVEKN